MDPGGGGGGFQGWERVVFLYLTNTQLISPNISISCRPVARIFERGGSFLGGGFGGGFWGERVLTYFSLIIHEIYNMYHHFVITHSLPLILLPNESLVQMLSNDMLHGMFKCPTFSSIIVKYHTNFIKYG